MARFPNTQIGKKKKKKVKEHVLGATIQAITKAGGVDHAEVE